jgi:hypothetical protein
MRVADQDGRPRGEFVRAQFGPTSPLLAQLAEQFTVRIYRFASAAERLDSVGGLAFTGAQTRVGAALDRAREELADVALAGVVVVTDGADGAPAALTDAELALRARGTPVFTVGVGRESSARDLEITRVEAPRTVLQGTTMSVDVVLSHSGLGGATVPVVVEDGGRIIASRDVKLPESGEAVTVRVPVPAADAGARRLTVRATRQATRRSARTTSAACSWRSPTAARRCCTSRASRASSSSSCAARGRGPQPPPRRASSAPPRTSTCAWASRTASTCSAASPPRARSCSPTAP